MRLHLRQVGAELVSSDQCGAFLHELGARRVEQRRLLLWGTEAVWCVLHPIQQGAGKGTQTKPVAKKNRVLIKGAASHPFPCFAVAAAPEHMQPAAPSYAFGCHIAPARRSAAWRCALPRARKARAHRRSYLQAGLSLRGSKRICERSRLEVRVRGARIRCLVWGVDYDHTPRPATAHVELPPSNMVWTVDMH